MSNSPVPQTHGSVAGAAPDKRGLLFIVSAPSGTGKTTLAERLVQQVRRLHLSRSYTSRPRRQGENQGVDYNFISRERFESMVESGEFLEWADIYGNYYGTSAAATEALLASGEDVVLVIDVQGARQVRRLGLQTVGIFVLPPSADVLEHRLRGRSQDSEQQVRQRLDVARREVGEFEWYEYVVINDALDAAVDRLRAIVLAERSRVREMRQQAQRIIATFQEVGDGRET
jgi:guanylate kinase